MRRAFTGLLIASACFGVRADGGATEMVVTNMTTILDVPVVTNLVTITTTNVITAVVTNSVPSPEEIAIENARIEEAERKRRIETKTFRLLHADATEVAAKFNDTWSGDFGVGV